LKALNLFVNCIWNIGNQLIIIQDRRVEPLVPFYVQVTCSPFGYNPETYYWRGTSLIMNVLKCASGIQRPWYSDILMGASHRFLYVHINDVVVVSHRHHFGS